MTETPKPGTVYMVACQTEELGVRSTRAVGVWPDVGEAREGLSKCESALRERWRCYAHKLANGFDFGSIGRDGNFLGSGELPSLRDRRPGLYAADPGLRDVDLRGACCALLPLDVSAIAAVDANAGGR